MKRWNDHWLLMLALGATTACSTTDDPDVVVRDRPVEVNVPVVQPCAGARPADVVPLKDKTPNWAELDVRQKAAAVGRQGLERQAYGEQLAAATGACP